MRGQEAAVRFALPLLIGTMALPLIAPLRAQDKPRVFVAPAAMRRTEGYRSPYYSERTTTVEDRTVEVSRKFSESCKEVTISADRKKADYVVRPNWQISRIAVYKQNGDLVGVAQKSKKSSAVKAACELINKDQPARLVKSARDSQPDSTK